MKIATPSIHPPSGSVASPIIKEAIAAANRIINVVSLKAPINNSIKVVEMDSGKSFVPNC